MTYGSLISEAISEIWCLGGRLIVNLSPEFTSKLLLDDSGGWTPRRRAGVLLYM